MKAITAVSQYKAHGVISMILKATLKAQPDPVHS